MSDKNNIPSLSLPPENEVPKNTSEIGEKLRKLNLSGMTSEILTRIESHPEVNRAFRDDIDALLATSPPNPIEISRMELLYIKGYGQTVTLKDGSQMTFVALQKMTDTQKKDEIVNGLSDSDFDRYDKYLTEHNKTTNQTKEIKLNTFQTTNQEIKSIDSDIKTANQEIETIDKDLITLNDDLKVQIEYIQKIKGVPVPSQEELANRAKDIPKLQGADPEKIKNGDYNNIILADYYVNHKDDIIKNIDPKDTDTFINSIRDISKTLERPYPVDWPKIATPQGGLVLGESRDLIRQTGDKIVASGYDKGVTWDPQSRSLIFEGQNGERKAIDTGYVPPHERIILSGLSIDREVPVLSKEEQEKEKLNTKEKTILGEIGNKLKKVEFISGKQKEWILGKNPDLGIKRTDAEKKYHQAGSMQEKLDAIHELQSTNENIKEANRRDMSEKVQKNVENLNLESFGSLDTEIEAENASLTTLEKSLTELAQTRKYLEKYQNVASRDDHFDTDARESLKFFSSLGLSHIGQDGFEDFIAAWNKEHLGEKDNTIDLGQNPKLDIELQRKLRTAVDTFAGSSDNRNETFAGLNNLLKSDDWRDTNWNNTANRAHFLFDQDKQNISTQQMEASQKPPESTQIA